MDLNNLFEQFKESAFRLETLPVYNVSSEVEGIAYFKAHGRLPEGHNADWVAEVRANIAAGKTMKRLRLFTLPLNDYEQFERAAYEANLEAGEQIRVLDRAGFEPTQDFWAFDNKWIACMIYDETGAWHGADVREMTAEDREQVARWQRIWDSAPDIRKVFQLDQGTNQPN